MSNDYNEIPWDDIPKGNYIPASIVLVQWESLEDTESQAGKRMFVATFRVMDPEDFFGRVHTERYVVGTDENPKGFARNCLGATGMQQARIAAKVKPLPADKFCETIEIERPQLLLQLKEPKPDADFQNNSIARYFPVGEREPGLLTNTVQRGTKKSAPKPPVRPPVKPPIATKKDQEPEKRKNITIEDENPPLNKEVYNEFLGAENPPDQESLSVVAFSTRRRKRRNNPWVSRFPVKNVENKYPLPRSAPTWRPTWQRVSNKVRL